VFCSRRDDEYVIGDLMEQFHRGRGRAWFWRQVIVIVLLEVSRSVRRFSLAATRILIGQGIALILLVAVLSAVLLSGIWPLFMVGIIVGIVAGVLKSVFGEGRTASSRSNAPDLVAGAGPMTDGAGIHRGISLHHIPVEGAVGLLFVVAVVLIFGAGVRPVRELLVFTIPLGILGSAILVFWHRQRPVRIQVLDLHKRRR
jgi:hypothetical protein